MSPARPLLTVIACIALLACAATAGATDKVYKWTDAGGVTHYGDAPPAQGRYETSAIRADDRVAGDAPEAADAGRGTDAAADVDALAQAVPGEDPQCATVRRHLALLRSDGPVQQDTDGDGNADKILSQEEREAQARLAGKMLATTCATPGA